VTLDPNRWTLRTQQAINAAGAQARSASQAEVTPEHLLASILAQPEGVAVPLLARAWVDTRELLTPAEGLRHQRADPVAPEPRHSRGG
jgi:ATP-dependent Clp protease ATP-binding subunit ClpA